MFSPSRSNVTAASTRLSFHPSFAPGICLGRRITYNRSSQQLPTSKPYLQSRSVFSNRSASAVASNFLSRFQSLGPQTRTQTLDANQLQLLSLTLNRNSIYPGNPSISNSAPPEAGTPIPPGHHLVYFSPAFLEGELGADGTDVSYNPDAPFTRRMWAGGEVRWPRGVDGKVNLLRVGQEVRETTRMLTAEAKVVRKTGEEMVVVGVEKVFENEKGVAIVDRRNWVFREALKMPSSTSTPRTVDNAPPAISFNRPSTVPPTFSTSTQDNITTHTRTLRQSAVTLFRFSALTFNGHKIHYSLPWAQTVEGHRGLVVHGPLNLICMLDLWRDVHGAQKRDSTCGNGNDKLADAEEVLVPECIEYRATSPLYAEEEYRIVLEEGEGRGGKVNIYGPSGVVSMKADIVA
ncbi:uncharacterized protein PADG_01265 [Paracoccidioides brasiliensis Pb18]|uniref:Mesaconyl-C4 CoA hydratase n=1 Tax=Paracoccidioides brasiliensis (strain Pb18) TaxID=502780 RepID=C1G2U9_PARBD|nr:uncharacterized protein PADG_01265 [Paracoccidioides brasiliensis Pb18]EEH45115.1 hypothetical protein PADG_01265 [Paracoccidioides brasiliensis Pb18]ODH48416.1 hypothetical protein GX48_05508 [Paracoccidioides brasiliensis]